jgi:3-keto-5-aminohexanoate cleavage enzyme
VSTDRETARPVVIAAAPTGAWKQRSDYPMLPVSADQVAEEARQCMEAGASMLHLHVRRPDGGHSIDPGPYARAVDAVRNACGDGLLIQLTTEAGGVYAPDEQAAAILELEHDFVSIAMSELLAEGTARDRERIGGVFRELDQRGATIQVILYDAAQLAVLDRLVGDGIIPERDYPLLYVLGRYHREQRSTPADLEPFLSAAASPRRFMVCAFGEREIDCMMAAVTAGGDARVGLENNAVRADGSPLSGSAESVAALSGALVASGYRPATAAEARTRLLGDVSS